MPTSRFPNYIRTCRKRAGLTQGEVAFLLGSKSSARVSRHERFKQTPDLETLLAYELLFQTPVRSLFNNKHKEVEQKLKHRIRLLLRKLTRLGKGRRIAKKIEMLTAHLGEQLSLRHAP
jgi:transcriptional regulator with XRE-family HTH domain